jgi:hypothetical protein
MDQQQSPASRRMVKGPKGGWKVSAAAPTAEELRKQQDLLALSTHLAGFKAPELRLK